MQRVAVLGGGGFIGTHLIKYLKKSDAYVVAIDLSLNKYVDSDADEFIIQDLRDQQFCQKYFTDNDFDEVYQLAADMGGAGYIFTGSHDADIMHNSVQINLNIASALKHTKTKVFYSSSACIYPEENQLDPENPNCAEESAFPANPDSEYGWEKLFSERLYLSYARNYGLDIRIARFHNIYGPFGHYDGGKEKAPSAICRKVAQAEEGDTIEIWGDGKQTRSFLYIDECLLGIDKLMKSDVKFPVNIGSSEMVTINDLARLIVSTSGKNVYLKNIDGPEGVRGRCSDNRLIQNTLGWSPNFPLSKGIKLLYSWVSSQL